MNSSCFLGTPVYEKKMLHIKNPQTNCKAASTMRKTIYRACMNLRYVLGLIKGGH
jgi:hypothetical protein